MENLAKELAEKVLKTSRVVMCEEELQEFIVDFLKEKESLYLLEDPMFFEFLSNEINIVLDE
jgi:hypothetical protein